MDFRHEWKYEINFSDFLILRARLRSVMQPDPHSRDGTYYIRSLYFDTPSDTALYEKLDGVNKREKFRIRFYNSDTSFISLEKKSKLNGLCSKKSTRLSKEQAQAIADGAIPPHSENDLINELSAKMLYQQLKPKTIVDYTRDAFIFAPGNVRVTLDHDIRTGLMCTDFLDPHAVTVPAGENHIILEVKWDEFLPDIIRDAVTLEGRHVSSFSKYAQCRIYV